MQLIDTHNHLYLQEFDADRDEVVVRAVEAGVRYIMLPNIDSSSVAPMMESVSRFSGICLPMAGLHPTSVREGYREELASVRRMLGDGGFYGLGETGIDLYWDKTFIEEQKISFRAHLGMARDAGLPVIIHSRESLDIVFDELARFGKGKVTGVFHAFPGNGEDARRAIDMGFLIGIGGVVTFRNSVTPEAALAAGPGNIVLETDAPYLTPMPYRGKRNESSYLTFIAAKLAELFSTDAENVGEVTSENAKKLFNLK